MALLGSKLPDHGLSEFYDSLGPSHLQPLWTQNRSLMPGEPRPSTLPWLWPWEVLRDRVSEAGRLVSIDRGGDRRVLSLANPGLGGRPFATSTLWGAVQYLGPGEGAPAHRHSQGAVRFVIEGSGVWTTVDGDACDMAPGDLVLTPAWTWHDHQSGSDGPMIWFDGLDMPLVESLDAQFFELDPAGDYQQVRGRNLSASSAGASGLAGRAVPPSPDEAHSPLLIYRWSETTAELDRALEAGGGTVARVEFVSPQSRGPVMATLGCAMIRIAGGARTAPFRATGSSIYVVRSGAGRSVIAGVEMSWTEGDIFVSPSWTAVEHLGESKSDLFVVSDRPVLEALHLYREELLDEPQLVEEKFNRCRTS